MRRLSLRTASMLTRAAGLLAAGATLLLLGSPAAAYADGIEITEVRTDQYPRMIVRFIATQPDGTPIGDIRAGTLHAYENGIEQEKVDFFSLRDSSPELWVSLVIDVSGSMNDDNKLREAKEAAKAFIARLRSKDRTAIITFSNVVTLHQQPTGDPGILNRAIDSLTAQGPTRLYDGIARGVQEVLRGRVGGRRAVIVLTDGEDTGSQTSLESAIQPAVEAAVPIYTIGVGREIKEDILSSVANQSGARYYQATQAAQLDAVFKKLSGRLSNQFEAWWPSTTVAPSGTMIAGRLAIDRGASVPPLESDFSFAMPVFLRPIQHEAAVAPSVLKPVETPEVGWELPPWWPFQAAVLAAIGVYALFYGVILRTTRSRLQQRLGDYVWDYQKDQRGQLRPATRPSNQTMRPVVLRLARLVHRFTPASHLEGLRARLVLAGRPSGWHLSQFLASKVLLAVGLGVVTYTLTLSFEMPPANLLAIAASAAGMGYYLPHYWLGAKIRGRQKSIQRALPDALDLITVGVGAGLSFDGAVLELVQKSDNALTEELANFLAELKMGRSRREALQGLQSRTDVEDLKLLVASLLQAEELGMTLSDTLQTQADQMRLRRRQRAEELAHKATIKMMFPMIMLIFPALFIVIIGPAVPSMMSFLQNGAGG